MFLHAPAPKAALALGPLAYAPAAKKVEITGAATRALPIPPLRTSRRESALSDVAAEPTISSFLIEQFQGGANALLGPHPADSVSGGN